MEYDIAELKNQMEHMKKKLQIKIFYIIFEYWAMSVIYYLLFSSSDFSFI